MAGKQGRPKPAKIKAAPPPDEHGLPAYISTDSLSSLTGVSGRRLYQLISDSKISIDCKKGAPDGFWHTGKALLEIFGYYRRVADRAKPNADLEMQRSLDREELRARKLKNAKAARELLPMLVMAQVWGELLTLFKERFLGFGMKIGPRAFRAKDKVEASEIIEKEIRMIFKGLPEQIEALAEKIRDDEFSTHEPAAGTPPGEKSGDLV